MLKRLVSVCIAICLAVCCASMFVGCESASDGDMTAVQDGKYYCYNAVDENYDEGELIEINGEACTLTVNIGGVTIRATGSIIVAGNTFTVDCKYLDVPIVISGEVEGDGILRIDSQTVNGHAEPTVDYYCQKGKKPAAKPEEKFYAYDTDNGEYNEYDVWTVVGNSCVWSFVDVFTTAVKEYKGTVIFTDDNFIMNLSGSFTTADTCVITYKGVRESVGVMRVESTTTTVYSDLIRNPSVNTTTDVIYYCKKGGTPSDIIPDDNKPDDNKPDDNKPDDNKPDDNKPDDNKPDDNKPDDNKPDDNNNPDTPKPPTKYMYFITFDGNGCDSRDVVVSVIGNTIEMPDDLFYRDGYELIGYNTQADGSGASIAVGETYEFTDDMTFYAMWRRVYKVKFDFNNRNSSIVSVPDREIAENEALGELPHPLSTGVCFIGWFDSFDRQYISTSVVDGDLTLYAHWQYKSVYDDYNASLTDAQQNGHIYFHYKSYDHMRSEEGLSPEDSVVYGDLAVWVSYSDGENIHGRLFMPTAVDFGGMLVDIDITEAYNDGGWDYDKRERGDESISFSGHHIKIRVVRLSSVYNDDAWSFIGGNICVYSSGYNSDTVYNVFTDEFQINRGTSSMGPIDGTYTPDLRLFCVPFSHY